MDFFKEWWTMMDYTFCPLPNTSWEGVLGMFLDIFGGRRFDSTFPFAKRVSFQVSCCVFYGVHVVQKRIHINVHYLNISRVFQIVQQKTWVAYYIYCSNYTTNFLMQKKAGFVGTNYNPILYLFQLTDLGPSYLEDTFKTLRILGPSKKGEFAGFFWISKALSTWDPIIVSPYHPCH